MRSGTKTLTAITILLLAIGGGLSLWSLMPEIDATAERAAALYHKARATPAYVLSSTRWTTFPLPPGKGKVKLISNANVPMEFHGVPGFFGTYAIQYQLLAGDDEILRSRSYTMRSGFSHYRSTKTGSMTPIQFYRSVPLLPMVSRATFINLEGYPRPPSRLRVRLSWSEPVIKDVVVRLFQGDSPPEHKLRYMWKRLSRAKRERLARANIYGVELLTENEKRNLLLNRSSAVGPLGAYDRDYVERRLYTLDKEEAVAAGVGILPTGLYVEERRLGVITLPPGGGCVRLEVERVCLGRECEGEAAMHISWFERGAGERSDTVVMIPRTRTFLLEDYAEGILEIYSPEPIVVRAFLLGDEEEVEITPPPECVPGYMLRDTRALELHRSGGRATGTPLRIDLRRLHEEGTDMPSSSVVRYEFLDESEEVIGSGSLVYGDRLSPYDHALGAFSKHRVTDASRYFLWVPGKCSSVNFYCDDPRVLLTAYTRPPGFERTVRVPEDYLGYEEKGEERSTWFLVRPRNYIECLREHLEVVLKVQRRPSLAAAWVAAGDFHVELLEPEPEGRSYSLVTPVGERATQGESPAPTRFIVLDPGEENARYLLFQGGGGRQKLTPRVLCFKPGSEPERIVVEIDAKPHLDTILATNSAGFSLAPVEPGLHRVTLLAPEPAVVLLNSVAETNGPSWLERSVYTLDGKGLRFLMRREGRERVTLSMRAFFPATSTEPDTPQDDDRDDSGGPDVTESPQGNRTRVRAMVGDCIREPGVPQESWTFSSILYDIHERSGLYLPLLEADGRVVSGGEPFFLTLGSDLPPGDKEVFLSAEDGKSCYVQVTRLLPGQEDVRSVFSEAKK